MVDKKHLQGKTVIIKINGLSRTLQGTVTHVDDDGFWISGDAIIAEIADAGGLDSIKHSGGFRADRSTTLVDCLK